MPHMPHPLIKDPIRYKTMMCENWTRFGSCPYSYKCQFAHGETELRARPREQRKSKAKENTALPANTKTNSAYDISKARFLREFLSRGNTTPTPPSSSPATKEMPAAIQVLTPICSPCSSRECSPRPSTTASAACPVPPVTKPMPNTCPPPPGLGIPMQAPRYEATPMAPTPPPAPPHQPLRASAAAPTAPMEHVLVRTPLGPIDFAKQAGAAGAFSCSGASAESFVPAAVSSLWATSGENDSRSSNGSSSHELADGEASPLRCNRTSGKVEPTAVAAAPVPWVTRRVSSAQELVRRSVSFVLGGLEELSSKELSTAEPSFGRTRSKGRLSFGLSGSNLANGNRSTLEERSLDGSVDSMASRRSAAASPYPEWA